MSLVRFSAALEHYKGKLDDATYWRYRGGRLPRLLTWLLEHPDLALALAEDAADLALAKNKRGGEGDSHEGR